MANVILLSSTNRVSIVTGDYSANFGCGEINIHKNHFTVRFISDTQGVMLTMTNLGNYTLTYDGDNLVDSVNGLAPASNYDLYNKIKAML